MSVDHITGFDAVVETITLAPADEPGVGELPLADVVSAVARGIGRAQHALDADATDAVAADTATTGAVTGHAEGGQLPPCYQITESTVDLNLVLRFPGGEARASYPDLAAAPGAVSTVRVVLRPVVPPGIVVPPPATRPATAIRFD